MSLLEDLTAELVTNQELFRAGARKLPTSNLIAAACDVLWVISMRGVDVPTLLRELAKALEDGETDVFVERARVVSR